MDPHGLHEWVKNDKKKNAVYRIAAINILKLLQQRCMNSRSETNDGVSFKPLRAQNVHCDKRRNARGEHSANINDDTGVDFEGKKNEFKLQ